MSWTAEQDAEFRAAADGSGEGFAPPNGALRPASEGEQDSGGRSHPPKRLGEDAFHGPAGRFVKHVEPSTEADPAAVLVQTLVMFGSALGRQAGFKVGFGEHFCNEFAVIVGTTSSGRKGTGAELPVTR